jgi:hypothetical protein
LECVAQDEARYARRGPRVGENVCISRTVIERWLVIPAKNASDNTSRWSRPLLDPEVTSHQSLLVDASATGPVLEDLVREHAALRRVATLVARETSPAEVFTTVTRELGELLGAQRTTLLRVDSPQWAQVVAAWSDGDAPPVPVGHRERSRRVAESWAACCAPRGP